MALTPGDNGINRSGDQAPDKLQASVEEQKATMKLGDLAYNEMKQPLLENRSAGAEQAGLPSGMMTFAQQEQLIRGIAGAAHNIDKLEQPRVAADGTKTTLADMLRKDDPDRYRVFKAQIDEFKANLALYAESSRRLAAQFQSGELVGNPQPAEIAALTTKLQGISNPERGRNQA